MIARKSGGMLIALCASIFFVSAAECADWTYKVVPDPMSDAKRVVASLTLPDGSYLALKCDAPGPRSVYVQFGSPAYLGTGRSTRRPVSYRFDDGSVRSDGDWLYGERFALLMDARPFESLLGVSNKVALRALSFDHQQIDAVFDVEGSAQMIAKVNENCGEAAN